MASLGQTYPENLKNPISHSGETHFATFLGRKPSWTQSNARKKTKLIVNSMNNHNFKHTYWRKIKIRVMKNIPTRKNNLR